MNCRRGGVCWLDGDMKNHDLLIEEVEGHCGRGKADVIGNFESPNFRKVKSPF
jgi:hypothetical protein